MTTATNADTTRWWWVRHAPVPDGGFIYGQTDLACDCEALDVFEALAALLPDGAVWLTSRLGRTHQTAAAIVAAKARDAAGAIAPVPVAAFDEQHLGDWQGLARATFWDGRPDRHDHWFGPATERAPNGESFADLVDRVRPAVATYTHENRGRDIVAVTHGGTIRAAMVAALGLDPEVALAFTIDNCSITRLDHLGGDVTRRWKAVTVNHQPWSVASGQRHPSVFA